MARRLLGADNAATVFNTQQVEAEPVTQVYTKIQMCKLAHTCTHSTHNYLHNIPTLSHRKKKFLVCPLNFFLL